MTILSQNFNPGSKKYIQVSCDRQIHKKCRKIYNCQARQATRSMKNIGCISCRYCSSLEVSSARAISTNIGDTYNDFTVISDMFRNENGLRIVKCQCKCGSIIKCNCCNLHRLTQCKSCTAKKTGLLYTGTMSHHYKGKDFVSQTYFASCRKGAENREILFKISIEDMNDLLIKQEHKCAITGLPISINARTKENTASLDRINSLKCYSTNNIQWLHKIVNKMKGILSPEDFIMWCNRIISFNHNRLISTIEYII